MNVVSGQTTFSTASSRLVQRFPRAQVEAWEAEVENADWKTPMDVKRRYPKADFPGKQQVIFDFGWNRYRLWVKVAYNTAVVIVMAIGTHKEYDRWPIE